jgi:hypothetical protein
VIWLKQVGTSTRYRTRYGTSLYQLLPAEPVPTLIFLLVPNHVDFIGISLFIDLDAFKTPTWSEYPGGSNAGRQITGFLHVAVFADFHSLKEFGNIARFSFSRKFLLIWRAPGLAIYQLFYVQCTYKTAV